MVQKLGSLLDEHRRKADMRLFYLVTEQYDKLPESLDDEGDDE